MKIRNGFVSNSSSSSFIIGFKNEISNDKMKDAIIKAMNVSEKSPVFFIVKDLANCLVNSAKYDLDLEDYIYEEETEKEILCNFGIKEEDFYGNWSFKEGSLSRNESDDPIESLLANEEFDYYDENIFIKTFGY